MSAKYSVISRFSLIAFATVLLTACGGSSSSGGTTTSGTTVLLSGAVAAPGGNVALLKSEPQGFERLFAWVFGKPAYGSLTGVDSSVGAGITVNLLQVDAAGATVGSAIASGTTTTGGAYSIDAPSGFSPGPQYILRAVGTGGANIDARVTSTSVDIDSVTNTASSIISSNGSLAKLSNTDVDEIADAVENAAYAVDTSSLSGVSAVTAAITTEADNNQEAANIISSTSASGTICGTVTDSTSSPLQNIVIVVRDFSNWVTRAKTRTDASGSYCVHVPVAGATNPDGGTFSGDYIVGAINPTTTSYAASEWYTSSGGANNQFSADKVSVPDTTTVTIPFQLADGGRIGGTVYASDGSTPLVGIKVIVRDFISDEPVIITRTKPDGTFHVNVAAGASYTVGLRNHTLQPYGGGLYNGPATGSATPVTAGVSTASEATAVTVSTSTTTETDFSLASGALIAGQVTDGTTALSGMVIRFYDASGTAKNGAFVDGIRTNKQGKYRIWLQPGTYDIMSRGQSISALAVSAGQLYTGESFTSATVNTITATVQDSGGNGVSQVKVRVYDSTNGPTYTYQGFEVSNSDGSVTLYTTLSSVLLEFKLDNGQTTLGSEIYNTTAAQTELALGSAVTPPASLGIITLPSGGELKGVVTAGGSPIGNAIVQLRNNGTTAAQRFISTRTQSDGSYSVSVPAGTYARLCAVYPGLAANQCPGSGSGSGSVASTYAFQDSVTVTASGSTTQNLAIP